MAMDAERLMRLDLFADLDQHDLAQVARWTKEIEADADTVLFEQGAIPYDMFVIEQGEVEVIRDGRTLATIGPGEFVGEMSLLLQERRTATVRTLTPLRAIAIPAEDIESMEAEMPEVMRAIRSTMERRRSDDQPEGLDR
jgi:CRP-like cAMP-binding protein